MPQSRRNRVVNQGRADELGAVWLNLTGSHDQIIIILLAADQVPQTGRMDETRIQSNTGVVTILVP
jgi:hypothetical protein